MARAPIVQSGPTWGQISTLVLTCVGIICALVGIIYYHTHEDIKELKGSADKAVTAIGDIRVDVATIKADVSNMKTNVSTILQRMPANTPR